MNKYSYVWLLSVLSCLLVACGNDDDYRYPSVKSEFLTAFSGASGALQSVLTDEGKTYRVVEDATKATVSADSLVRIVGNYAETTSPDGTAGVKLYGWLVAVSPFPVPAEKFKDGVKTDPADVQSLSLIHI